MKRKALRFEEGFRVVFGNRHAQDAEMTMARGTRRAGLTIATAARINGSTSSAVKALRS